VHRERANSSGLKLIGGGDEGGGDFEKNHEMKNTHFRGIEEKKKGGLKVHTNRKKMIKGC